MRSLTGAELIAVWDAGQGRHALDRALVLARAAAPEMTWDELCRLAAGRRDALLLALREGMSGERLPCWVECPSCRTSLELTLRVSELRVDEGSAPHELEWEDYRAMVRAADSLDLAAVVRAERPDAAIRTLIERCTEVVRAGERVGADAMPAPLVDAIAQRMSELDPGAELILDLACVDCGHAWSLVFDVVEYVWSELASRARKLLRDVHVLARAYGWPEADILSLSEARRRAYLDLVQS